MKEKLKNSLKAKFLGEYTGTSNKQRSLIVLIVGFSILFILLILVRVNYNNNSKVYDNNNYKFEEKDKKNQFLTLDKIFNNYLDNYKYDITVNDNDINTEFKGSINNKIDNGKRIINEQELEYHIVDNIAIDLKTNKEITDLYNNYLSYFFIPTNIYEYIKDKENNEEIVDNNKIYIYNSIYNDGDIMFKITTTKDRIEGIEYAYNNINYNIKLD